MTDVACVPYWQNYYCPMSTRRNRGCRQTDLATKQVGEHYTCGGFSRSTSHHRRDSVCTVEAGSLPLSETCYDPPLDYWTCSLGGFQALIQVLYLSDFKPITSRNHSTFKSTFNSKAPDFDLPGAQGLYMSALSFFTRPTDWSRDKTWLHNPVTSQLWSSVIFNHSWIYHNPAASKLSYN